jgi:hypothetical protein
MQVLFLGLCNRVCIFCDLFNQHALIKTVARSAGRSRRGGCCCCFGCGCCHGGSSVFILLFALSCYKAISFEELVSLASHVCLELGVWKDVEAGWGFVEVSICDRCDARVRGLPEGLRTRRASMQETEPLEIIGCSQEGYCVPAAKLEIC